MAERFSLGVLPHWRTYDTDTSTGSVLFAPPGQEWQTFRNAYPTEESRQSLPVSLTIGVRTFTAEVSKGQKNPFGEGVVMTLNLICEVT